MLVDASEEAWLISIYKTEFGGEAPGAVVMGTALKYEAMILHCVQHNRKPIEPAAATDGAIFKFKTLTQESAS